MNEPGVDWWGYIEGDSSILVILAALILLAAIGYLIVRTSELRSNRKLRSKQK